MNLNHRLLGLFAVICILSAGLILGASTLQAQTIYVPNANQDDDVSDEADKAPPTLYMPSGNGDFISTRSTSRGQGASSTPKIYNAPDERRTRRPVSQADSQMRSQRLKEIENINIQTAHNQSVENSKRIEADQQQWKAAREAYNKQYFEQEAAQQAKDAIAVQNGVDITGNGQGQGIRSGSGETIYIKKDPKTDLQKPARIFNIFD
jgi:hypothetical protein